MMNKEMKSERITLRVAPTEKEEIEKKAAQAHLPVSKYLVRVAEFDDPKKFKEDVLVNICASIFYPAQDLQKIIDGINSEIDHHIKLSGFAVEKAPALTITALSDTSINFIKYQAKTM